MCPESLSPSTPRCPLGRPPIVLHHYQLENVIHDLRDTILVALDFEMIHHPNTSRHYPNRKRCPSSASLSTTLEMPPPPPPSA
ncbi:hypothetical protein QBC32DRAFT_78783 [Pseudoneurospora amorphoporcata]|uniref:Uncharacterized protein n=1 Tax=Pseudoneurospora amorphoporcata TaxID=241081 RepID=A0AAN6NKU3_9PEZI|nr:hypothetical protein QBC32DRAFT_78783 [Pseudoneurospora amorphoporcata]